MPNGTFPTVPCRRRLGAGLVFLTIAAELFAAGEPQKPAERPAEKLCWAYKPRELTPDVIRHSPLAAHMLPMPSMGAGGGAVFFVSPRDHRLLCLDAQSGKCRWEFTTGAPVREAPTYSDGRVYVGCDDGWVYCLDAASGKTVWKHPPPAGRRILAFHRMVSAWPVRTNVLVHKGVAYFGSGIFPHDGAFVTALDAKTGKLVWQNAASGEYPHDWGALSPVGEVKVADSGDRIIVTNEGMGGKAFALADGQEFHRAARNAKAGFFRHVGCRDGGLNFGMAAEGIVCRGVEGGPGGRTAEAVEADSLGDTSAAAAAAEAIVKLSGIKDGYAVVLDCQTGALAMELARKTNLIVYAVFRGEAECNAARQKLQRTGLYGTRVVADYYAADTPVAYPKYLADVVVSEAAQTGGRLPAAVDIQNLLKPYRGMALIGSTGGTQTAEALQQWAKGTGLDGWQVVQDAGRWARCVRGPLDDAGAWTHQNADPGNTMCSHDGALKPPIGVVWYGGPYAKDMVNRSGVAPLIVNGVLIAPGANSIEACDQYTGRQLWRRDMKNVSRTNPYGGSGNLAANSKYLFVIYGGSCRQLDLLTGQTVKTHGGGLGWLACDEKRLYLSRGNEAVSKAVFAIDIESGKTLWTVESGQLQFQNNTVAVGDGSLYFIMDGYTPETRKQGVDEMVAYAKKNLPPDEAKKIEAKANVHDVRILVAVDIETGKTRYERGIDVTDCGGATNDYEGLQRRKYPPVLMYRNGLLAHYNASAGGKLWGNWANNNWTWRGIAVRKGEDGSLVWFKPVNFRGRALIVEDTIHADPFALDLKTGQFKMRTHPVRGQDDKWTWCRWNKHCGIYVASKYFLFGRSGGMGYHDLLRDRGLYTFLHSRPNCWFDTVSGGGMMIKPPQSNGCTCEVTAPFTYAMATVEQEPAAPQIYSSIGPSLPAAHVYVNFGGMGDYHDPAGNLWLAANTHRLNQKIPMLQFRAGQTYYEGGKAFVRSAVFTPIANTDIPAIFATMALGLKTATIPLAKTDEAKDCAFRVALGFSAPPGDQAGQRVFDVKLQGKIVLKDFDVAKEAGGIDRAVWKEFDDVHATAELTIELVAKSETPTAAQMPILCAAKVLRK